MLTFAYPLYLLFLIAVPVMILIYYMARNARKKNLRKFGRPQYLRNLIPHVSPYKPGLKFALLCSALALLVLCFARPWGSLTETNTSRDGIEVMIAMDASNSMLASSTSDPSDPSRMDIAKIMMERMIDGLASDRVGLIVYAAQAYTLIPVSSDYASAKSFLSTIDPMQMPMQGTNIADAINSALNSFTPGKDIGKAIVLITDAEDLEDENGVMKAVADAKAKGVQINVIGVGSSKGSVIDMDGELFTDDSGQVVHTALNEDLAKKIASAGNGVYVNASAADALPLLQKRLKEIKRSSLSSSLLVSHDELFIWFAAAALLLLVVESLILNRKNAWLSNINFFTRSVSTGKGIHKKRVIKR